MTETPYSIQALDPNDSKILEKIQDLYHRRLEGEDRNIGTLFQAFVGAVNDRPAIIVVKGQTRAGKSLLVKTVIAPFQRLGLVLSYSRITPTFLEHLALQYWAATKSKSQDEDEQPSGKPQRITIDIPERILFIDEMRGASQSTEPVKLNFSEGRIRLGTVIKNRPVEIELRGIKVMVTTSTSASFPDPEFENRVLPLQIDESTEQTGKVLDHQALEGEGLEESEDEDEMWLQSPEVGAIVNFLNKLKPVHVSIPFASELARQFPRKSVFERGEFPKVKRFLRNVATIHQYQRVKIRDKKTLSVGIAADPADWQHLIDRGLSSFKESFTGISDKEQKVYDILKGEAPLISIKKKTGTLDQEEAEYGWTVRNLADRAGFGRRGMDTLRKLLKRMIEDGYVDEDDTRKPFRYYLTDLKPVELELKLDEYRSSGLEAWVRTKGYEIVNVATSPLDIESGLLDPSKPETFCVPETQHGITLNLETGTSSIGNGDVALSNQKHGAISYPGPESSRLWHCQTCKLDFPDQLAFQAHVDENKGRLEN